MNTDRDQKYLDSISKRIKELRIQAGYTSYEKFAVENDMQRKQYWRLETGHNFEIKSLLKIIEIHKITLEEFFKGIK